VFVQAVAPYNEAHAAVGSVNVAVSSAMLALASAPCQRSHRSVAGVQDGMLCPPSATHHSIEVAHQQAALLPAQLLLSRMQLFEEPAIQTLTCPNCLLVA
jgi:hypothetical protein